MREPKRTMNAEMNVTPFLDILLVLLILFMFICMNQQKVMEASLPDPTGRPGDNTPPVVLEVKPNAMYAINTQLVSGTELAARLRGIYAGRPTKTIIVRGTPGVRYQEVVTAMDIARSVGVEVIGLATRH